MAMTPFRILSCDGGGIRGLLSALLLQKIAQTLGPAFLDNARLYAGTSTGGLIALGLAGGLTIDDVVSMYTDDCHQIFTPNPADDWPCVKNLGLDTVLSDALYYAMPKEVFEAEYTNSGLLALLRQKFPGNPTLGQLEKTVLVTTLQLSTDVHACGAPAGGITMWQPLILQNITKAPPSDSTLIDAALSTSAAPTYFPPYRHPLFGYCVDGGTFANNPSALAIGALRAGGAVDLADIRLLSVGTGLSLESVPPDSALCGGCAGTWQWIDPIASVPTPATPLLSAVMDNTSAASDWLAGALLGQPHYQRINPVLSAPVALDHCGGIQTLRDTVNEYTRSTSVCWQNDLSWIRANWID